MPGTCATLTVTKNMSYSDLSNATLQLDLALGVRRQPAPEGRQK